MNERACTAESLAEVVRAFLKLGLTSFGGPVAHLGYFREEFIVRRRWLDEAEYADLVALCQFLPGPASTQLVFAVGARCAGVAGGVLAAACFILPSALVMILLGLGANALGVLRHPGWIAGLKVAVVAVVAQAVWGMARQLCPDVQRAILAALCAAAALVWSGPPAQIGVIAAGAVAGCVMFGRRELGLRPPATRLRGHVAAAATLAVFLLLLLGLPLLARITGSVALSMFDGFFRSGALVFGGGHVVLPLLHAEVVPRGWVPDDIFLAGYAAAQAMPGPLFTFAGYLGAAMGPWPNGLLGGVWCLVAIFLPGLLLVAGTLPFWDALRSMFRAQAALRGTNASVVGLLLAALCNPVWTEGIKGVPHFVLAAIAFVALALLKLPPWLVVVLAASAGAVVL